MLVQQRFYIDGVRAAPGELRPFPLVKPATGLQVGNIALGSPVDVDRAVAAARRAFEQGVPGEPERKRVLMQSIARVYESLKNEIAHTLRLAGPPTCQAASQQHRSPERGPADLHAPFGDYKELGLGRERGPHGFDEHPELKSMHAKPV